MKVPFERFRVFHGFWNSWNRFTVEVAPAAPHDKDFAWIELDEQRKFIDDAIREKFERERKNGEQS